MNKHVHPNHTAASLASPVARSPRGILVAEEARRPAPYQLRFDECTACDTAVTFSCEECCGTGEVLAGCCVCEALKPLDEDRYCAGCLEPTGWALAEKSAYGMGGVL